MYENRIKELAAELSKDIKSEAGLAEPTQIFVEADVEKALGAEIESHLGCSKNSSRGRKSGN